MFQVVSWQGLGVPNHVEGLGAIVGGLIGISLQNEMLFWRRYILYAVDTSQNSRLVSAAPIISLCNPLSIRTNTVARRRRSRRTSTGCRNCWETTRPEQSGVTTSVALVPSSFLLLLVRHLLLVAWHLLLFADLVTSNPWSLRTQFVPILAIAYSG